MARPSLELTFRIEWDEEHVPYPPSEVQRVLTKRLHLVALRDFELSVTDDGLARVRLYEDNAPAVRAVKRALGMYGFALRVAARSEVQGSFLRTGHVPEGYQVWDNPKPMDGDYSLYGDSVLLEDPPLLTGEFLREARSWEDKARGGGIVMIDFDDAGASILDSRSAELYARHPRGLIGITLGESLRWLGVVSSGRLQGRVAMMEPTESEARQLAAHLSSGYLPARLGATVEGRFVGGHPQSTERKGPPVDLDKLAAEVVKEGTSLSIIYDRLAECSEHEVLEQGMDAIRNAMERCGGMRWADSVRLDMVQFLGRLFGDASLELPQRADAIAIPDDRSALAVVSEAQVRVLSLARSEWSKPMSLSSPLQGMEFVAPAHLIVRMAADDRNVLIEGPTMSVRRIDQEDPVSVTGFECVQAGAILGKSRHGRFIAYRTARSGGVGVLDLDSVSEGLPVPLVFLDLQEPCTYPARTHLTPDGARALVTTFDSEYLGSESGQRTQLFQLVDTRANQVLGTIKSAYENYFQFSWSPDGRWIACHEEDKPMPGWDVPVGSTLRKRVRLFDGLTAEEMWSAETRKRGAFGWPDAELVSWCGTSWDVRTGDEVER